METSKIMRTMKIQELIGGISKESRLQEFANDYFISEYLNVYSTKKKTINLLKSENGSMIVVYYKPKKPVREKIPYLAAKAFLAREEGKPYVVFKDGDCNNRHISNLEWSDSEK